MVQRGRRNQSGSGIKMPTVKLDSEQENWKSLEIRRVFQATVLEKLRCFKRTAVPVEEELEDRERTRLRDATGWNFPD